MGRSLGSYFSRFDDLGGVASDNDTGGDLFGDHCTSGNHAVVVDGYIRADKSIGANPYSVTDRDRRSGQR